MSFKGPSKVPSQSEKNLLPQHKIYKQCDHDSSNQILIHKHPNK